MTVRKESSMEEFPVIPLRARPELRDGLAVWFHQKWGIPLAAYEGISPPTSVRSTWRKPSAAEASRGPCWTSSAGI